MEERHVGVMKCSMNDFSMALKMTLKQITGLTPTEVPMHQLLVPLLVLGKPGAGKTALVQKVADELNVELPPEKQIKVMKLLLSQVLVGEMKGIPVVNPANGTLVRALSDELPVADRDGDYGILFLDEVTTCENAQVAQILALADHSRSIGAVYTLPPNWLVVLSGNGPDCSNFETMHDAQLSRCHVYDVAYNYKEDWRPWAHANNIDPMIIAYLNFKPDMCLKPVSTEMSQNGFQFPCPRSWENLHGDLLMWKCAGMPVKPSKLAEIASRNIGTDAAVEFAAFCRVGDKLDADPDKIIDGTEAPPQPMKEEMFHILLESVAKKIKAIVDDKSTRNDRGQFARDTYQKVANVIDWFIAFEKFSFELTINAIAELRSELGSDFMSIMVDDTFKRDFSKSFDDFVTRHIDVIMESDNVDLGIV